MLVVQKIINPRNLIGKGVFTKCYAIPNTNKVLLQTKDTVKRAMADYHFIHNCKYIPKIKEVGINIYESKKYIKVTAPKKQLNNKAYTLYLKLKTIIDSTRDIFEIIKKLGRMSSLINHIYKLSNFIDINNLRMEISPRNIATDSKGNLILLDIFYDHECLISTKSR